jgi:hypothetical protein
VGRLHALARGDHSDHFPVPTEAIQEVKNRTALTLGTLLHDVGKPYGSPHSEIGAGLAVTILRRLGRTDEDIRLVEFLVRQHLVMGQMSQRRDLEDLGMIADFATLCGDEEFLRQLYLLTFCDLASVAPDAMSSWKETLLAELYTRTMTFLRRGPDLLGSERAEIVKRRQARAARMLGEDPDGRVLAALYLGFPDRYFAENTARRIASHMEILRARRERLVSSVIEVAHQKRLGVTEMVLAARDTPGLLADVAGVLYANRIEVVDAAIYSRASADPRTRPGRWTSFRADSMGQAVWAESVAKVRRAWGVLTGKMRSRPGRVAPRGESVVAWKTTPSRCRLKVDNGVSKDFTSSDHHGGPAGRAVRHHAHAGRRAGHSPLESRPRPTAPSTSSTCATRPRARRSGHPHRDPTATLRPLPPDVTPPCAFASPLPSFPARRPPPCGKGRPPPLLEGPTLLNRATPRALTQPSTAAKAIKDARPHCLGRRAREGGQRRGCRAYKRGRIAQRPTSPSRTTTWGRCCWPGRRGAHAQRPRAAVKGAPDYAEASTTGRRARRAGQKGRP